MSADNHAAACDYWCPVCDRGAEGCLHPIPERESGRWAVTDVDGHTVLETTDRFDAEDALEPGYTLDWKTTP